MKWLDLPGPARFINQITDHLREGQSTVVATPLLVLQNFEQVISDKLNQDRWRVHRGNAESVLDPLTWLTDQLYIEPKSWINWSTEGLFECLSPGQVIVIKGITPKTWGAWRSFIKDFDIVSRRCSSDERPVLLIFVRGVSIRHLQIDGAALSLEVWSGVLSELDTLTYIDQFIRRSKKATPHHKLIVRQIAALSLWDLEFAEFLADQPTSDLFDVNVIVRRGQEALRVRDCAITGEWEDGGADKVDENELIHSFVLIDSQDPTNELNRRVWAAQAAELLPAIEIRRRASLDSLRRYITCPFWLDGQRKVTSLEELEIGTLAFAAHHHKVPKELRDKVQLLADCRNSLAHLKALNATTALDRRLYE
ncbi:MAG: hypothetical protein K9J78_06265 [Polynucleobacter sp.]|nr:hypothetical protein [Polynucleobacter sp.]